MQINDKFTIFIDYKQFISTLFCSAYSTTIQPVTKGFSLVNILSITNY